MEIEALKSKPYFTTDELFYWEAYQNLFDAGYTDISQYSRDNFLTIDERSDLIRVLNTMKNHHRGLLNADS